MAFPAIAYCCERRFAPSLPCDRRYGKPPSSGRIGFLEHPPVQREIVIALEQVFGVPVAALHTVEIAAIDMDGRGQAAAASISPPASPATRRQKMLSSRPV
jgi:hypothetical protein